MHPKQLEELKNIALKYQVPIAKVKEFILPPVGKYFILDGLTYKVTYTATDKCRFTAEFIAVAAPPQSKKKEGFIAWLTKRKKTKKKEKKEISVRTSG